MAAVVRCFLVISFLLHPAGFVSLPYIHFYRKVHWRLRRRPSNHYFDMGSRPGSSHDHCFGMTLDPLFPLQTSDSRGSEFQCELCLVALWFVTLSRFVKKKKKVHHLSDWFWRLLAVTWHFVGVWLTGAIWINHWKASIPFTSPRLRRSTGVGLMSEILILPGNQLKVLLWGENFLSTKNPLSEKYSSERNS